MRITRGVGRPIGAGILAGTLVISLAPAATGTTDLEPVQESRSAQWSFLDSPVESRSLGRIVRRVHTITVVELTTSADPEPVVPITRKDKRAQLKAAERVLETTIPGVDIQWRWKITRSAPPSVCNDPTAAFAEAHRYVPESRYLYQLGRHLAVIVNCGFPAAGGGLSVRVPPGGTGQIWAGWFDYVLAHEILHNLGLGGHTGSLMCDGSRITPKQCSWIEYADPIDILGNSYSADHLTGVWRDLVFGSRTVPTTRVTTWKLDSPVSGRVARPLRVEGRLGFIYLDRVEDRLAIRLAIRSAPVDPRDPVAGLHQVNMGFDPFDLGSFVSIGETRSIPGTDLNVTVDGLVGDRLQVTTSPRDAPDSAREVP